MFYRTALLVTLLLLFITSCAQSDAFATPASLPTLAEVAVVPTRQHALLPTPTLQPTVTSTPTSTHTPTITPSPTATSTATPTLTPTPTATPSPTPIPPDKQINGVPLDEFIIMPPTVQAHVLEIYALGQEMERYPHMFSKLGDSTLASPNFLVRLGQYPFDLGDYAALQETIAYYQISFRRLGPSLVVGLHATSVFSPDLINTNMCDLAEDENMLDCEFRLQNPSILLIALGTNDEHELFHKRMEGIVTYAMERGIIPVLITKADRHEGEDNRNNISIRQIATEYEIPLIDFDRLADTLPKRGLGHDDVHLTEYEFYEYSSPEAFQYGYAILNLSTVIMLDELQQILP